MRSSKGKTSKLPLLAALTVGVIALLTVLEVTHVTHFLGLQTQSTQSGPTAKEQEAMNKADAASKDSLIKQKDDTQTTQPAPPTTDSVELTAAKESADQVVVRTKLHDISHGSCDIHVENNDKIYEKSVQVLYQDVFSTCAGFTIPVNQLGLGNWSITLVVVPESSTPITKKIDFKVD